MKMRMTKALMIFTCILVLSGGLTVYAATSLFTQTFSGQTFTTASLVEGSCGGTLQLDTSLSTIPTYSGDTAAIVYDCGSANGVDPSFSTQGTISTSVTVTPTYTVPSGWSLSLSPADVPSCPGTALTSGTPISLQGGSPYLYCLTSSSASNYSSFSITWSQ